MKMKFKFIYFGIVAFYSGFILTACFDQGDPGLYARVTLPIKLDREAAVVQKGIDIIGRVEFTEEFSAGALGNIEIKLRHESYYSACPNGVLDTQVAVIDESNGTFRFENVPTGLYSICSRVFVDDEVRLERVLLGKVLTGVEVNADDISVESINVGTVVLDRVFVRKLSFDISIIDSIAGTPVPFAAMDVKQLGVEKTVFPVEKKFSNRKGKINYDNDEKDVWFYPAASLTSDIENKDPFDFGSDEFGSNNKYIMGVNVFSHIVSKAGYGTVDAVINFEQFSRYELFNDESELLANVAKKMLQALYDDDQYESETSGKIIMTENGNNRIDEVAREEIQALVDNSLLSRDTLSESSFDLFIELTKIMFHVLNNSKDYNGLDLAIEQYDKLNGAALKELQRLKEKPMVVTIVLDEITPVQVGSDADWSSLQLAEYHMAALKQDGSLYTWGNYNYSVEAVINGKVYDYSPTPKLHGEPGEWRSIETVDASINVAIKKDGTLWTWFNGADKPDKMVMGGWVSFDAKRFSASAVADDGSLWLWKPRERGDDSFGFDWQSNFIDQKKLAINDEYNYDWTSVNDYMILKSDHSLWSLRGFCETEIHDYNEFEHVHPLGEATDWKEVVYIGDNNRTTSVVTGIKQDGSLWACGQRIPSESHTPNDEHYSHVEDDAHPTHDEEGQELHEPEDEHEEHNEHYVGVMQEAFIQIGELTWKQIAASENGSMLIKDDGTLWRWDGRFDVLPVQVGEDTDWAMVGVSARFGAAIKTDGTLWTWGNEWWH